MEATRYGGSAQLKPIRAVSGGGKLFQAIKEKIRSPLPQSESSFPDLAPLTTPTPTPRKASKAFFSAVRPGPSPPKPPSAPPLDLRSLRGADPPPSVKPLRGPDPPPYIAPEDSEPPKTDRDHYTALLKIQGRHPDQVRQAQIGCKEQLDNESAFKIRYNNVADDAPPSPVRTFVPPPRGTSPGSSHSWQNTSSKPSSSGKTSRQGSVDLRAPRRLSERPILQMKASHFSTNFSFGQTSGMRSSSNLAQYTAHNNASSAPSTPTSSIKEMPEEEVENGRYWSSSRPTPSPTHGVSAAQRAYPFPAMSTPTKSSLSSSNTSNLFCLLGCGNNVLPIDGGVCEECQPRRPITPPSETNEQDCTRPGTVSPLSIVEGSQQDGEQYLKEDVNAFNNSTPIPRDGFDSDSSSDYDDCPVDETPPVSPQRDGGTPPQTPLSPRHASQGYRASTLAIRRQQRQHDRDPSSVSPTPKIALQMQVIPPRQFRQVSIVSPIKSPTKDSMGSWLPLRKDSAGLGVIAPGLRLNDDEPMLLTSRRYGDGTAKENEPPPEVKDQRAEAFAALCGGDESLATAPVVPSTPPMKFELRFDDDVSPDTAKRYSTINDIYDDYIEFDSQPAAPPPAFF